MDVRTIDSFIGGIASAYHLGLGLPSDTATWVRQQGDDGHAQLAVRVSALLRSRPIIAASLAVRHPFVICDEHQDSSGDQHAVVMAMLTQGARLRLFADPMQKIFKDTLLPGSSPAFDWAAITQQADAFEQLDTPHRWTGGCLVRLPAACRCLDDYQRGCGTESGT
jgi:UvrD/REP helicase N-terminal domain